VWEWNETAYDGTNDTAGDSRELRGGSLNSPIGSLGASWLNSPDPSIEGNIVGFRVAMIPEPSSLSLLALGGVLVAVSKRKRA